MGLAAQLATSCEDPGSTVAPLISCRLALALQLLTVSTAAFGGGRHHSSLDGDFEGRCHMTLKVIGDSGA